jgi:hypothetical protein
MSTLQAIAIIVGLVSGVSGLVLGILNYLHQRDTTCPRLVVRPYVFRDPGPKAQNVGYIEVCNVGQVPVVGVLAGFRDKTGKHVIAVEENLRNDDSWPRLIEPQHAALLRFNLDDLPKGNEPGRAFAQTVVGDTFKASRRNMRKFAEQRKAALTELASSGSPLC